MNGLNLIFKTYYIVQLATKRLVNEILMYYHKNSKALKVIKNIKFHPNSMYSDE
jgi:hypothetical protein